MYLLNELPDQLRLEIKKSDLEDFLKEISESKHPAKPLPEPSGFQPTPKEILTVEEVAELTGLAKQTIYTNVCKRLMPHYKARRKLYFKRTEITEWMLQDRRKTHKELQKEAADFIENRKRSIKKNNP